MTRARTTKTLIRARMAKTGERYTTARRHVLASAATPDGAPAPARPVPASGAQRRQEPRPQGGAAEARGAVSEARVIARTGHDLAYWFRVLDAFGAAAKGHTASARFLRTGHGVDGWYSQAITVLHERARGIRTVNQRVTGVFAFSASKTVAATLEQTRAAFEAARARRAWTRGLDAGLVAALAGGLNLRRGAGFVPRSRGQVSCRLPWGDSRVEILLTPRLDGRTAIYVDHSKLASRAEVEARRPLWRAALAAAGGWIEGHATKAGVGTGGAHAAGGPGSSRRRAVARHRG